MSTAFGERSTSKRGDAVQNRARIIQAAFRVLGEVGVDAQMADIAAAAGLGIATVYRNFPSKEALVNALVQERLQSALRAIEIVEAKDLAAWEALVKLIRSIVDHQMENRVLSQFLGGRIAGSEDLQEQRDLVYAGFDRLIERAKRAGDLRPDVGVSDIRLLMVSISHLSTNTAPLTRRLVLRHLGIMIDGLRAPARSVLEGQPLTIGESEVAFATSGSPRAFRRGRPPWPGK